MLLFSKHLKIYSTFSLINYDFSWIRSGQFGRPESRCSDRQTPALQKIFQEKKRSTYQKRSQLEACLEYVRGEKVLVNQLARSTLHLYQITDDLKRKSEKHHQHDNKKLC